MNYSKNVESTLKYSKFLISILISLEQAETKGLGTNGRKLLTFNQ